MKQFYSILFVFLTFASVVNTVRASVTLTLNALPAPLCNTSCDLTISFPNGGTLTATQDLFFTFGEGGEIDLGTTGTVNSSVQPASLSFFNGDTLSLAAGENITFDVGGFVNTAAGGNLDYTAIALSTDVDVSVVMDEGSTDIKLYDITVTGTGAATFTADGIINVFGPLTMGDASLILDTSSTIAATGDTGTASAECSSTTGGTSITLTSTTTIETGSTTCTSTITANAVSGVITIEDGGGGITTTGANTLTGGTSVLTVGDLQFTSAEEGAGAFNWKVIFLFVVVLFYSRRRVFSIR